MIPVENNHSCAEACDNLLKESNQLYRLMLHNLNILSESPEAATAQQMQGKLLKFNELQQQIEANDSRLTVALNGLSRHDHATETLLAERRELIAQVLTGNKKVTLQAQAIQSLLADEIRKATAGRTALKGYRQPEQHRSITSFKRAM